jgi:hypothetical protein
MGSFVEKYLLDFLGLLNRFTLFNAVRSSLGIIYPNVRKSYMLVDSWVVSFLVLSATASFFCITWSISGCLLSAIVVLACLRIYELVVYQARVTLASEEPVLSSRRIVILLLFNYAEITLWFTLIYFNWGNEFEFGAIGLSPFAKYLALSFFTMTSFGYSSGSPKTDSGYFITLTQSAIGFVMVLLVLGAFISEIRQKPQTHTGKQRTH